MYFCCLMLTVFHYFLAPYLILMIIYVVWMYKYRLLHIQMAMWKSMSSWIAWSWRIGNFRWSSYSIQLLSLLFTIYVIKIADRLKFCAFWKTTIFLHVSYFYFFLSSLLFLFSSRRILAVLWDFWIWNCLVVFFLSHLFFLTFWCKRRWNLYEKSL